VKLMPERPKGAWGENKSGKGLQTTGDPGENSFPPQREGAEKKCVKNSRDGEKKGPKSELREGGGRILDLGGRMGSQKKKEKTSRKALSF